MPTLQIARAAAAAAACVVLVAVGTCEAAHPHSAPALVHAQAPAPAAAADDHSGFRVGNRTFLLDGEPVRLFAGSLQHFRIHPDHWEHRLKLAKHAGLNAVQTLIPWFLMEPTPGAFVTDGFVDIVRFSKLCATLDLKIVLRPGPFICDGPDFGARQHFDYSACAAST